MEHTVIDTGSHVSNIYVGEKWTNITRYIPHGEVVIITDDNVLRIYGHEFPEFPVLSVTPGESSKSLSVVENLAEDLMNQGIDRSGFILAIGGGVVCDIAGFLASIYMRGISFGFVSTTLLSQVDASVGGKNAVNVGNSKNIIGNFRQPDFVICDPSMLHTLSEEEYLSGLAELIKMGFIMDRDLVEKVETSHTGLMKRDQVLLAQLVDRSVKLKAVVVTRDEKETGLRMILNFGHTFGHIIETVSGKKHGFAVASGMEIAADISVLRKYLDTDQRDRMVTLLRNFGLCTQFSITPETFERMLLTDKKKSKNEVSFVLLESLGNARIDKIHISELVSLYRNISGINEG